MSQPTKRPPELTLDCNIRRAAVSTGHEPAVVLPPRSLTAKWGG